MSRIVDDLIARAQAAGDEAALAWKDGAIPGRRFWDGVAGRAESLSRSGVAQGDRVAIWLPKGPATVETLFAVMINGAIAVPIDPGFPAARATAVLGEIGPAMLVTDGKRRDMLAGGAVERSRVVVTDAMEGSEPGGDPLARKAIG
ncbi:MAG: AMP-binding protein, partial [Bauldia litoralis]